MYFVSFCACVYFPAKLCNLLFVGISKITMNVYHLRYFSILFNNKKFFSFFTVCVLKTNLNSPLLQIPHCYTQALKICLFLIGTTYHCSNSHT